MFMCRGDVVVRYATLGENPDLVVQIGRCRRLWVSDPPWRRRLVGGISTLTCLMLSKVKTFDLWIKRRRLGAVFSFQTSSFLLSSRIEACVYVLLSSTKG